VRWFLVGAPGYLKKRGRPRSLDDLKEHECVTFGTPESTARLRLEKGGKAAHVGVSSRLLVNDFDLVHAAALAGLGLALLPAFQCVDDLRAKRLERVLRDWEAPVTSVHVVYASTRHISPKLKSFIDHLQARMAPPPWELGPMP